MESRKDILVFMIFLLLSNVKPTCQGQPHAGLGPVRCSDLLKLPEGLFVFDLLSLSTASQKKK